jgi:shikimate kinase
MATSPVVAITGPRTAGKSTLAIEVTGRTNGTFVDLDDPAVRRLATAVVSSWRARLGMRRCPNSPTS